MRRRSGAAGGGAPASAIHQGVDTVSLAVVPSPAADFRATSDDFNPLMSESVSLAEGSVDVGDRLREIRLLRRKTLREVAERAGLSESFLSQVERGRTNVS